MKTCVECKYFYEVDATQSQEVYHRCTNPRLRVESPVLGLISNSRPAAEIRDDINLCGPEGQWYESPD